MGHILVTGGSRGIGKAVCLLFKSNGWRVSYFYRNTLPNADDMTAIRCDVRDGDSVKEAVEHAESINGTVDVLVSNSGISVTGLATDFGTDEYRSVMDTNFGGLFNVSNAVIPSMIHNKQGVIIAISSMWGQTGASCEALYAASKGAVDSYVRSLAKELGPSGIRVNAVSPGVVETDMMSAYSDEDKNELKNETPLGRLGTAEDIANAVYFLASPAASYITGQIIGVNGGFLI